MADVADHEYGSTWSRGRKFRAIGLSSVLLLSANPVLANAAAGNWGGAVGVHHPAANQHAQSFQPAGIWHSHSASQVQPTSFTGHHFITPQFSPTSFVNAHANPALFLPSLGIDLDLTSSIANIVLGANVFGESANATATVNLGGTQHTFQAGQKVTAAEFVAIQEVLGGGGQTVTLNHRGAASGGDINLNQLGSLKLSEIVIPRHVTAVDNLTINQGLHLTGDLLNYGSITAISTDGTITSGTISAINIVNKVGGVIAGQDVSLNLLASGSIVNAGRINSGGNLNLSSGSGNFVNSGLISSNTGNVNFTTPTPHAITIDNTRGTVQALAGNINVRDASYVGDANTNLVGGNYLSQNLNVYAGNGAITGSVDKVTGNFNSSAQSAHVVANTANLKLGNNSISGDPLFVNTGGDIEITGSVDVSATGEPLTIIATGNVFTTAADTSAQLINHGGNITVVAGANVSSYTGKVNTGSIADGKTTPADGTVTLDLSSSSATGGNIDLSNSTQTTIIDTSAAAANAGNVTLAAYAKGGSAGLISLSSQSTVDTHSGGGSGGNVSIISGTPAGVAAQVGSIAAAGTNSSGAVSITSAQPTGNTSTSIVYNMTGAVDASSSSTAIVASAARQAGTIIVNKISAGSVDLDTPNGNLFISDAGGNPSIQTIQDSKGNGGSIALNFNFIDWSNSGIVPLRLDASGTGSGNGGTVTLTSPSALTLGNAHGEYAITATSGASGGNGGTMNVTTKGTLTFDGTSPVAYDINPQGAVGNGGNLILRFDSIAQSAGPYLPLLSTPGFTSGNGGNVSLTQTGTNPINIGQNAGELVLNSLGSSGSGGGNGGNVSLKTAGSVFFDTPSPQSLGFLFSASATSASGSGNGGNLTLSANGIDWKNSANTYLSIGISSQGSGNGGNLSITNTSGQNQAIGHGNGQFELYANGTFGGGNAGSITFTTGGQLSIDPGAIGLSGPTGLNSNTQGRINLIADKITVDPISNGPLTAGAINIVTGLSGLGAVGTGNAYPVSTSNLTVNSVGSVYITNAGPITVNTSTTPGTFSLVTTPDASGNGSITIGHLAFVSAGAIILTSSESGAGSGGIFQVDSTAQKNSGGFQNTTLYAAKITLADTNNGDINVATGNDYGAGNISVTTTGNVTISDNSHTTPTIALLGPGSAASQITIATPGGLKLSSLPTSYGGLTLTADVLQNGGTISLTTNILTVQPDAKTGKGGTINLTAENITWAGSNSKPLQLTADSATGSGGSISVNLLSAVNVTIGGPGVAGAYDFTANGKSAGSVSLTTTGSINLDTAGSGLAVPTGLNLAASGGNGATIDLTGSSLSWSQQATSALLLAANGTGAGNGGTISLTLSSAASLLRIGSGSNDVTFKAQGGATSGNGGNVNLNIAGSINVDSGAALAVSPLAASGNGGDIHITANALYNTSGAPVVLNASALSGKGVSGNGGSIAINVTNILDLGNYTYGFEFLAQGGTASGNGGSVTVVTNGNINFGVSAINVAPLAKNADGGTIFLIGDNLLAGPGVTQINLNANGIGTGNGGSIRLSFNNALSIGNSAGDISLSATGVNGGSIGVSAAIISLATTITGGMAQPVGLSFGPTGKNGDGGDLLLRYGSLNYQNSATSALLLKANGAGSGNGGTIQLNASGNVAVGVTAGTIDCTATGSSGGSVSVSTAGNLAIATTVVGSVATPSGLSVTATGANGSGGSISLTGTSMSWTGENIASLNLNVNGQGTGNGGSINIAIGSGSSATIGSAAGDYNLSATSGKSGGDGGSISFYADNITIDPSGLKFGPLGTNGNGGQLQLNVLNLAISPAVSSGPLTLDASGVGTGSGGSIAISQNGATAFTIGSAVGDFKLTANSGLAGGNGGFIQILANTAPVLIDGGSVSVLHQGATGTDGSLEIQGATITSTGPSPIVANKLSAISANGTVTLNTQVAFLTVDGNAVTVTNAGSVTVQNSNATSMSITTAPDAKGNGAIVISDGGVFGGSSLSLVSSESGTGSGGISQIGGWSETRLVGSNVSLVDLNSGAATGAQGNIVVATQSQAGQNLSIATAGNAVIFDSSVSPTTLQTSSANSLTLSSLASAVAVAGNLTLAQGLNIFTDNLTVNKGVTLSAASVVIGGFGGSALPAQTTSIQNLGTISGATVLISGIPGNNLNLLNSGVISGTVGNVYLIATPDANDDGGDLSISGGGTINAGSATVGAVNLVAASSADGLSTNSITFSGDQTFNGTTNITASGTAQSLVVNNGVKVVGNNAVNIVTPLWIDNGSLTGNPVNLSGGASGGVTIADNNSISLNLLGSLVFSGKNLTFLSAGNITDHAVKTNIDTSSATGNGGNVYFLAGFNFTPSPPPSPSQPDASTTFTIAPNPGGSGNISMSFLSSINTSGVNQAGNVYAYANNGSVTISPVTATTTGTNGNGGNITIIGATVLLNGGNNPTTITGTGTGTAGNVNVTSANVLVANPVYISQGNVSGTFAAGAPAGTGITIGNIINAGNGSVTLTAPGATANILPAAQYVVTAGTLTMSAGGNIGVSGNSISMSVSNLNNINAGGSFYAANASPTVTLTGTHTATVYSLLGEPAAFTNGTILIGSKATITGTTSVFMETVYNGGNIDMVDATGSINSPSVTLISLQGGVGGQNPIFLSGTTPTTLQAQASGISANVALTSASSNLTLTGTNSGQSFGLTMTKGGDINFASGAKVLVNNNFTLITNGSGSINFNNSTNKYGSNVDIEAPGGTVTLSTAETGITTTHTTSNNGGTIVVKAGTLATNAGSNTAFVATAQSFAQGGTISVTTTNGGLTIGSGNGQLSLNANGSFFGSISVTAKGGDLTVDPAAITASPGAGTAKGTITLTGQNIFVSNATAFSVNNLDLTATTGSVGTSGTPIVAVTSGLSVHSVTDAYILNTGAVTLGTSNVGGIYSLAVSTDAAHNGAIVIGAGQTITAKSVQFSSSESNFANGGITQADPSSVTTIFAPTISLVSNGSDLPKIPIIVTTDQGNSPLSFAASSAGAVNITTSVLTTAGADTISGSQVNLASVVGQNLTINNQGTIKSTSGSLMISASPDANDKGGNVFITGGGTMGQSGGVLFVTAQTSADGQSSNVVEFTGSQIFSQGATLIAGGVNQAVIVDAPAVLNPAGQTLTINSPVFVNNGTVNCKINFNSPSLAGTYASSSSIDLSTLSNLSFGGSQLTILSGGDITDNGKSTLIDLSNGNGSISNGNGGSLYLLAGFKFNPSAPAPTVPDTSTAYNITGTGSGNIDLSNTTIMTGSTIGSTGGGVYAYANGHISINTIDTTSAGSGGTGSLAGGPVTIIGKNIIVNNITTSGATNGAVNISSAAVALNFNGSGNSITVRNGQVFGGSFQPGTAGGSIQVLGSIVASAASAGGSRPVNLTAAGGGIIISGSITTNNFGTLVLTGGPSLIGGNPSLITDAAFITANTGVGGNVDIIDNNATGFTIVGANSGTSFSIGSSSKTNTVTIDSGASITAVSKVDITVPGGISFVAGSTVNTPSLNLSTSGTLTVSPDTLTASTSGSGTGGNITVTGNPTLAVNSGNVIYANANGTGAFGSGGSVNLTIGAFAPQLIVTTNGNGVGSGGVINITSNTNLAVGTSAGSVQVMSTSGPNGTAAGRVNLVAPAISITTDASGNAIGSGLGIDLTPGTKAAGGWLQLTTTTGNITWSTQATQPLILSVNGNGLGGGGLLSLQVPTTQTVNIGTGKGDITFNAIGGAGNSSPTGVDGGSVQVTAGTLLVDGAGINVGTQAVNGNAGGIGLTAQTALNSLNGQPVILQANGSGQGSGGVINVQIGSTQTVTIGNGLTNSFEAFANAGSAGGNGGVISASSGGNIVVNPAFISMKASGSNGNGGDLSLIAGQSGPGTVLVTGALTIAGSGSGFGGGFHVTENSPTAFVFGSAKTTNGLQGNISVPGGAAGNGVITAVNSGGGITVTQALTAVAEVDLVSGKNGGLTISNNLGNSNTNQIYLDTGSAGSTGKISAKVLQANGITVNAGTPALTLTVNTSNLFITSAGAITVTGVGSPSGTLNLTNIQTSGKTAAVVVKSPGNIAVTGDINGTSVTLQSTSKTNGMISSAAGDDITASTGAIALTAIGGIQTAGSVTSTASTVTETASGAGAIIDVGVTGTISATGAKGAVTLTAAGAGAELTIDGSIVSAGKVAVTLAKGSILPSSGSITSTSASVNLSAASATFTGALSGTTGVAVKVSSTAKGLQVNSVSSALGSVALTAVDGILITGGGNVNAGTTIVATSTGAKSGIDVENQLTATGTKGAITLTASGTNGVIADNAGNLATTAITLTATKGSISQGAASIKSTSGAVTLTAGNAITQNGSISAATSATVKTTIASSNIANTISVNDISTVNGPILISSAGSMLSTNTGSVIDAEGTGSKPTSTVTMLDTNATAGRIVVNAGSTIETGGTGGGNVRIAIPGTPAKPSYTATSGATFVVNIGGKITTSTTAPVGGPFLFGPNGITVQTSSGPGDVTFESITQTGAPTSQIIISTGKLGASAISIAGTAANPTLIKADPPTTAIAPLSVAQPRLLAPPSQSISLPATAASANTLKPIAMTVAPGPSLSARLASAGFVSNQPGNAVPRSQFDWISDTEIASGAIPAVLNAEIDLGVTPDVCSVVEMEDYAEATTKPGMPLSGTVSKTAGAGKSLALRRGSVLFAPAEDTLVRTPYGTLSMAAKSLVLVIAYSHGLAVYDLDDTRQAAVKVTASGQTLALAPGRSVVLTRDTVERFADINPAQLLAYRGVRSHSLGQGQKAFTAEFSAVTAAHAVLPLRQLMSSAHPEAKRITNRLLKTTAIISQMQANAAPYQQYLRPSLSACAR